MIVHQRVFQDGCLSEELVRWYSHCGIAFDFHSVDLEIVMGGAHTVPGIMSFALSKTRISFLISNLVGTLILLLDSTNIVVSTYPPSYR